jgi:Amt family ammonium transporter
MKTIVITVVLLLIGVAKAWAGDEPPTPESNKAAIDLVQTHADYVWTLVAAALVFFMQGGFALVETGFTRAKNAINIMMKNLMDFSVGSLAFWALGFGIMFGVSSTGWFGTSGFFLSDFTPGGGSLGLGLLDVSGGLLRDGGDHCLRGHGREDQVCRLFDL